MFLVSFFAYVLITVDVASGILSNSNTDSNSDWYYNYWCNQHDLEYLDDSRCRKQFPSVYDRNDWACPTRFTQEQVENNGFKLNGLLNTDNVDVEILGDIVTNGADVCVIVSKRVLTEENDTGNFISNSNAQLYNKYFCAGNYSIDDYYETWSSSKIFAVSNAASHLQANESTCENLLSLNSDTTGKHGRTPLGDLISIICSYDTTAAYSSNSLSSYFHDIGFRSDLYNLIHSGWLYESDDNVFNAQSQSLGGNYGEQTPDDLSFALSTDDYTCTADKDPWEQTFDNSISALSAVEMTRRIVQHREIPDSMKYPGMTWEDVKVCLPR